MWKKSTSPKVNVGNELLRDFGIPAAFLNGQRVCVAKAPDVLISRTERRVGW